MAKFWFQNPVTQQSHRLVKGLSSHPRWHCPKLGQGSMPQLRMPKIVQIGHTSYLIGSISWQNQTASTLMRQGLRWWMSVKFCAWQAFKTRSNPQYRLYPCPSHRLEIWFRQASFSLPFGESPASYSPNYAQSPSDPPIGPKYFSYGHNIWPPAVS